MDGIILGVGKPERIGPVFAENLKSATEKIPSALERKFRPSMIALSCVDIDRNFHSIALQITPETAERQLHVPFYPNPEPENPPKAGI
jgi:hypothetical protein